MMLKLGIIVFLIGGIPLTSAVPPTPPNNEAILYANQIGVLPPNDYLLMTSDIKSGLLCIGGNGLKTISWSLPNGMILNSTAVDNIRLERPSLFIANLSSTGNMLTSSLEGIYMCRTEFVNGVVRFSKVWIVNNISTAIPSVNTTKSSCSYIGADIRNQTHGVFVAINVLNGPPTNITCQLGTHSLVTTRYTFSSTSANVLVSIPFNIVTNAGNMINCNVRNRAGSVNYNCEIESNSKPANIKKITRTTSTTANIRWTEGSVQQIIVESTDGSDFIQFKNITKMGSQATIYGLHPPLDYHVILLSHSAEGISRATNRIALPSISERKTISPQQCSPSNTNEITLELKMIRNSNDNNQNDSTICSSLNNMAQQIFQNALEQTDHPSSNCSISDIKITFCGRESTPRGYTPRKESTSSGYTCRKESTKESTSKKYTPRKESTSSGYTPKKKNSKTPKNSKSKRVSKKSPKGSKSKKPKRSTENSSSSSSAIASKKKKYSKSKSRQYIKVYLQAQVDCGSCTESRVATTTSRSNSTPRSGTTRSRSNSTPRSGTTRRQSSRRQSSRRRNRRKTNSKTTGIKVTIAGREFNGCIKTKSISRYCGKNLVTSKYATCNCPSQCYERIDKEYSCLI